MIGLKLFKTITKHRLAISNPGQRVFIIGSVWIEPNSSAAGSRMLQLMQYFLSDGCEVFFGTTAAKNPNSIDLNSMGVQEYHLELNSSSFDELLKEIDPTIVLFDRFMTEEQFGWRVHESAPNALKILDTEDLHCLRKIRQDCIKRNNEFSPNLLLNSETAKREIASIYRSDLTLVISRFEMEILKNIFNISDSLLCYLPFLLDTITEEDQKSWKGFDDRSDFVSIGNFLHAPNLDATIQLKQKIWPKIRKEIPTAQLHVYGAYPTQQVLQLSNKKEGFLVHGFVENADEVISSSRVLLAPLRFGAGLKGKLIQAMVNGTPSVTTSIGSEGMHGSLSWPGFVEDDSDSFIKRTVELYQDQNLWKEKQKNGVAIINSLYSKQDHLLRFSEKIQITIKILADHRSQNFIGQMLQHHTINSYKYLSKWIEEKNKD